SNAGWQLKRSEPMQLGFIGTGTMGNPMARCLLEAGHALTVYDMRREATANLCERGARWADNPCAVASASEVVFTSLPGPVEVEQTLLDPARRILAGIEPGGCYIGMTTNSPTVFRRLVPAAGNGASTTTPCVSEVTRGKLKAVSGNMFLARVGDVRASNQVRNRDSPPAP
ncbi:MAG TPA: NAD(P)-binding domain-containing protein, partial [Dehalococcoidia bacterium]|nr:NAD(P)-binding domain-containing protein [Dehalococcoidia bacterium]